MQKARAKVYAVPPPIFYHFIPTHRVCVGGGGVTLGRAGHGTNDSNPQVHVCGRREEAGVHENMQTGSLFCRSAGIEPLALRRHS